jgi:hypothetical protein
MASADRYKFSLRKPGWTWYQYTGVGYYAGANAYSARFVAPSDPRLRWDDPGHRPTTADLFRVMRQSPENGRHGFVLHDECWLLLQKAFEPDSVPIDRLLNVCNSLPFPFVGSAYVGVTVMGASIHSTLGTVIHGRTASSIILPLCF